MNPTVSGIGFYLHKDFGAAEVGILSTITQRMSRGQYLDFIYAPNSARPGSNFYLHIRSMGPVLIRIYKNLGSRMGAVVKTISALRALVLQNFLRTMSEY